MLAAPGVKWLSILTLTQTFVGSEGAINPVYWSLCYEEQFYLLIAATMVCAAAYRPPLLLAITIIAAATYCLPSAVHIPGLFIDRWLSFALGLAVFGWFDSRYGRSWALAMFAIAIVTEAITWRVDLGISLVVSAAFVALRRHDAYLSSLRPVSWLAAVGAFSYSLYLIHVPIAGRIVNLARRLVPTAATWWLPITAAAFAGALAAAVVFHQLVEKRFQRSDRSLRPASIPDADVALA
jgi:peptidoglycan/LPS O-acetylase OafA/YrhL